MPVYYHISNKAALEVRERIEATMGKYHPELAKHDVTVDVLIAWHTDGEAAVKLHGYACAATIGVTPYKQRVLGVADAVMTVDGETWNRLAERERESLIDHELQHLEVQYDDEGETKSDDLGRPKLKLRLHDWELGGFEAIVRRHGKASIDWQSLNVTAEKVLRQLAFEWSDDMAGSPVTAGARA
jgi:hypothetical protein